MRYPRLESINSGVVKAIRETKELVLLHMKVGDTWAFHFEESPTFCGGGPFLQVCSVGLFQIRNLLSCSVLFSV